MEKKKRPRIKKSTYFDLFDKCLETTENHKEASDKYKMISLKNELKTVEFSIKN